MRIRTARQEWLWIKRFASVVGATAVLVLVLGYVFRTELLIRWHMRELETWHNYGPWDTSLPERNPFIRLLHRSLFGAWESSRFSTLDRGVRCHYHRAALARLGYLRRFAFEVPNTVLEREVKPLLGPEHEPPSERWEYSYYLVWSSQPSWTLVDLIDTPDRIEEWIRLAEMLNGGPSWVPVPDGDHPVWSPTRRIQHVSKK
jgi:hypothetical protein